MSPEDKAKIEKSLADLKEALLKNGHSFSSDTDSEVIAHLIESSIANGCSFESAFVNAVKQLKGAQVHAHDLPHSPEVPAADSHEDHRALPEMLEEKGHC